MPVVAYILTNTFFLMHDSMSKSNIEWGVVPKSPFNTVIGRALLKSTVGTADMNFVKKRYYHINMTSEIKPI